MTDKFHWRSFGRETIFVGCWVLAPRISIFVIERLSESIKTLPLRVTFHSATSKNKEHDSNNRHDKDDGEKPTVSHYTSKKYFQYKKNILKGKRYGCRNKKVGSGSVPFFGRRERNFSSSSRSANSQPRKHYPKI
ncbi:hypothetical protein MEL_224 [Melbournevirus]|uniref:hypothetical protein n=1 Tax=Melbournevirus TaxID=1560514 RepID=UPI00051F5444|nr:hypothetical protein MEL_224 [Melbournevirus]